MLTLSIIFILSYIFVYLYLLHTRSSQEHSNIFGTHKKLRPSILIVISHPDDECMFFAPTILYLVKQQCNVTLLCLSTGNFYGAGKVRIGELINSGLVLGIKRRNIHCLDAFQDGMSATWDSAEVAKTLKEYVDLKQASIVLSFDDYGVSGHPNHIAVYKGLRYFKKHYSESQNVKMYALESVNKLRKYIQILDIIPSSTARSMNKVVSNYDEYAKSYQAMLCHESQLKWFRKIYILFSRYLFINTWSEIKC